MRIFLDANVIIDYITKRDGCYEDAREVLRICSANTASLAPHTISNIFFILRKDFESDDRKDILLGILDYIDIVPTGKYQVKQALLNRDIDDFEDALQLECAKEYNADFIVTRDLRGFHNADIKVISPSDFIRQFGGGIDA